METEQPARKRRQSFLGILEEHYLLKWIFKLEKMVTNQARFWLAASPSHFVLQPIAANFAAIVHGFGSAPHRIGLDYFFQHFIPFECFFDRCGVSGFLFCPFVANSEPPHACV
jgi:hypothetical protein